MWENEVSDNLIFKSLSCTHTHVHVGLHLSHGVRCMYYDEIGCKLAVIGDYLNTP